MTVMTSPQFERDLALARTLGHGEFQMEMDFSDYLNRQKFWFTCECGYRSTVRWSAADGMAVARLHVRKIAKEHRENLRRNGGAGVSPLPRKAAGA
jgi:hypothetical protein